MFTIADDQARARFDARGCLVSLAAAGWSSGAGRGRVGHARECSLGIRPVEIFPSPLASWRRGGICTLRPERLLHCDQETGTKAP